jgi:hypothetical protein
VGMTTKPSADGDGEWMISSELIVA